MFSHDQICKFIWCSSYVFEPLYFYLANNEAWNELYPKIKTREHLNSKVSEHFNIQKDN